jgi:serine/threonine protein kinase
MAGIGTGSFGAVYRTYQTTIGRDVAIKIILTSFANHPDFTAALRVKLVN